MFLCFDVKFQRNKILKTKTFSWVVILISVFVKMGTEGLGGQVVLNQSGWVWTGAGL